jgi:hypothetical protein
VICRRTGYDDTTGYDDFDGLRGRNRGSIDNESRYRDRSCFRLRDEPSSPLRAPSSRFGSGNGGGACMVMRDVEPIADACQVPACFPSLRWGRAVQTADVWAVQMRRGGELGHICRALVAWGLPSTRTNLGFSNGRGMGTVRRPTEFSHLLTRFRRISLFVSSLRVLSRVPTRGRRRIDPISLAGRRDDRAQG